MEKRKLAEWAKDIYSQNGEDGIINKIFNLIGTKTKVAVEFGAWDGFHLSNTAQLLESGWQGVLIEGVKSRYEQLKINVAHCRCLCINAFVSRDGSDSIEEICKRVGLGPEVDLLSIDIDGDDYYIIESLNTLRPRVLVCEYNPTIPAEVDLYGPYGSRFGASVKALCRVAATKGYSLIAVTNTNCIFVQDIELNQFVDYEIRLSHIKLDNHLVYLATNYNGDYVCCGNPAYGISIPYRGKLIGNFGYFPAYTGHSLIIRLLRILRKMRMCLSLVHK